MKRIDVWVVRVYNCISESVYVYECVSVQIGGPQSTKNTLYGWLEYSVKVCKCMSVQIGGPQSVTLISSLHCVRRHLII